ncbi:argininosuccinate lyase [Hydrogenispora ethanolica]|uniref:Argininosuccinate lyase n=1 Tax=Hydrogenispora ethanolica TaxID=1082276 RepID=A0A4V2QD81_HYDET|nr:argininosuccinate lyase [Hydrogenispora ethanolica]TCL63297.1 argininosuccinate lyase [Hydrogenispora ethanolica]
MYTKEYVEATDGVRFPGKSFQDAILEPVFDVQKQYLYRPFIKISKAHLVMLQEQQIITPDEARAIMQGLLEVETIDFESRRYDPSYEDMFFMVENALADKVGIDLAGRMHIARSRNDLDICEFRMVLREKVLEIIGLLNTFREVLLNLAAENIDTVMPAYTHTQPAQPSTLAHYLLAFHDSIARDCGRLMNAYHTINHSPIGAAAITTTGFPINRERMGELLGFDGLVENSYDCIAGCDYLTECASALMICNTNLSKFMKDVLDFCTREFNAFYLSAPYVQISSIMPQKRNPSSLEHTRPMISKAIAEANAVFTVLHNTPFGDIVDTEEQLQPHLYDSIEYTARVLKVVCAVLVTLKVNKKVLFDRAHEGFITATELCDTLVREKGLSFRLSHKVTSALVRQLIDRRMAIADITTELIDAIAADTIGQRLGISDQIIRAALDPVHFVAIRTVTGGPAPGEVRRMLAKRNAALETERAACEDCRARLRTADAALADAIAALLK